MLDSLCNRLGVKHKLSSAYQEQKMSITTDAWTACNNQEYLSITLHWIDKEWNMKNILLDSYWAINIQGQYIRIANTKVNAADLKEEPNMSLDSKVD